MSRFKSYLATLFLALLLFPIGEKLKHELAHLNTEHCDSKGTHYCAKEHSCVICDYVFSSSSVPPQQTSDLILRAATSRSYQPALLCGAIRSTQGTVSLRGPPAC